MNRITILFISAISTAYIIITVFSGTEIFTGPKHGYKNIYNISEFIIIVLLGGCVSFILCHLAYRIFRDENRNYEMIPPS